MLRNLSPEAVTAMYRCAHMALLRGSALQSSLSDERFQ
jgi:hypothetical protein